MKAIVAVDSNWGIGCNGKLLAHIPEDMKFFRETTAGKVVVMGRETFESFPGRQPLKNRVNIILSRKMEPVTGVTVCASLDELEQTVGNFDTDDVFVIGGESVYTQLLPLCDKVFVTKIYNEYPADRHFPDLDRTDEWIMAQEGEKKTFRDTDYRFTVYVRK